MKAYVFTDKALERYAGQFVWLSLDVEKAENAAYKKKYGVDALPTFLVLDPKTEKVALRWVGGASVPQLVRILADATAAVKGRVPADEAALARADRAYAESDYPKAAVAYREAIAKAPAGWPRYGRAVESLLYAMYQTKDYGGCARLAREAWPRLKKSTS
ncbi:MAG TPA: thioredoxin family protein, partial [Thermoanaerobaculia bacterium]|nr:thioredoxin family protein [Thermoanaerobaculia bacterium]